MSRTDLAKRLALAGAAGLALAAGGTAWFFDYAILRRGGARARREAAAKARRDAALYGPRLAQIEAGRAWFAAQPWERVSITSRDGLRLAGRLLVQPGARRAVLMMHGFRGSADFDLSCAYRLYWDLGFSILTCDQRAHGESEGRCIRYGTRERYDCRDWAAFLAARLGPETGLLLDGVSMGATTVLLALALDLPPQVRGVVADCGFTSAWDQFAYLARRWFRLPPRPLLDGLCLACRALIGFDFRACSTTEALAGSRLPVLLLHGEADRFVPPEMSRRNAAASRGPCRLLTVPGAGHGMSVLVEPARVAEALRAFVDACLP